MNILGHGMHTPHAEAAIRHVKNKARSTVASLPYTMPVRWAAALMMFVIHTVNMVPRTNAPGHISAYTSFTGRIPNFNRHTPHAFGIAGFLQKASSTRSNTADPRADYCIWLGTTRNLAGTNMCFNLATLRVVTGDIFRPAPLTNEAATRISRLAGVQDTGPVQPLEPYLMNPSPPYPLDPNRGEDSTGAIPPEATSESEPISITTANDSEPTGTGREDTPTAHTTSEPDNSLDENPEETKQIMLQVSNLNQSRADNLMEPQ